VQNLAVNLGSLSVASAKINVRPTSAIVATSVAAVATRPTSTAPAVTAVTAVPVKNAAILLNIGSVRYVDPILGRAIGGIPYEVDGTPRDKITIPVCTAPDFTDGILAEDPKDAAKKFYLPRYRLARQNVSGQEQYRATLGPSDSGWALILYLEKYAAPELGLATRDAKEMGERPAVLLKYTPSAGPGIQKELLFQEYTDDQGLLRAVLRVNSLPERDELFYALTTSDYKTALIVRRTAKVAIPVVPPKNVRVTGPLFREKTCVLDNVQSPFIFDRELHSYIFKVLPDSSAKTPGFVRWPVDWQGATHSYYQEVARPAVFHYLPDVFKLARRPQSPHVPLMALQIDSPDGSLERTQATLDYTAFKYEDTDRLENAALELRKIPNCLPPGTDVPSFIPLAAEPGNVKFSLALPKLEPRDGAIINTQLALKDSLKVAYVGAFDAIWDAMNDPTGAALLFQGQLEVTLGTFKETVPFIGRMSDMAGELFDYTETPDEASGGLNVILKNAIESPLKIKNLKVHLQRDEMLLRGEIQRLQAATKEGLKESLPLLLGPNEELRLRVVPSGTIAGTGPLHAVFDLDSVEVVPDLEQILNLIVFRQKPEYTKKITLKTHKEWFSSAASAGTEPDPIVKVLVKFEGGGTIGLDEQNCEAVANVQFPFLNLLTRRTTTDEYSYSVTLVRKSGIHEGPVKKDNIDELWIDPRTIH
jgi:hypothetical protein